jgi:hypothetical protein
VFPLPSTDNAVVEADTFGFFTPDISLFAFIRGPFYLRHLRLNMIKFEKFSKKRQNA